MPQPEPDYHPAGYARAYYWRTVDRRRKLAREGKQRRRWGAWLLRELQYELDLRLPPPVEPG